MPAAQEKKLEKKRRILESAYQLFQKNNVYNTAVDDIVKAAGIARGTFYLYFRDKSDLIEQLLFFKSAESMKAVMTAFFAQVGPLEDLEAYCRAFITRYTDFLISQREALAVIDKNIAACMRYFPDFYDEDGKKLYNSVVDRFVAEGYRAEDVHKAIYMIVDLIGTVCCDAILYGRPFGIEQIRPALTEAAVGIMKSCVQKGEPQ